MLGVTVIQGLFAINLLLQTTEAKQLQIVSLVFSSFGVTELKIFQWSL